MSVTKGGEQWCTGGFLFDGVGKRKGKHYLGLAAHCWEDEIGAVVGDEQGRRIGVVAYSHWTYSTFADDVALVELDRSVWSRTDPTVRGFPGMPTAVASAEDTRIGDLIGVSGHGFVTENDSRTREGRRGVLQRYSDGFWAGEIVVSNGDSGGPVVSLDKGEAVGSISNYCVPAPVYTSDGYQPGCTGYGPSIDQFVRVAKKAGFPVVLRTAKQGRVR